MEFSATDCILVIGRRGCGKSFLARLIQKISGHGKKPLWPRRVVFDPMDEYAFDQKKFPHRTIARNFDEFTNELDRLKKMDAHEFELIVKTDLEQSDEDQEATFDHSLKLLYYFENVQIVIEEVQLFSTAHRLPRWLKNDLLIGRHRGLGLMFTSQRPAEVHKTILSQCHHIFCGQISEGNDLRYLANFLGDHIKKLPAFKPREFLYYGPHGVTEICTEGKNLSRSGKSEPKKNGPQKVE